LPPGAAEQLHRLLEALAAEPDPPTTVREPTSAIDSHVADSLSGLQIPALRAARRIADVGAGAGFPGLVLAIALPDARVDLIESARRKAAVIDRLRQAARIDNARPVIARAEEWAAIPPATGGGREAYDAVTARAVASLVVLAEYASPLLRADGALVAWKGARDAEEERAARAAAGKLGLRVGEVVAVTPFPGARNRHLHVLEKLGPTPAGYPRRPGTATKRPLA
jgi:16S rRNA (guanine527-N7)-methyltransferase